MGTEGGEHMNIGGFEIERKFLIAMPAPEVIERGETSHITQTYLVGEPCTTERVRCRAWQDHTEYTHTIKRKLSNMRRLEDEHQVDGDTYRQLLLRADPDRRVMEKDRCVLVIDGLIWELDIFPFWKDRALLELELTGEEQRFTLPDCFTLIREVTDDPRYTNAALSREIVTEQLP